MSDRIYSVPFDNFESGWELAYEIREAYIIDNERGSDYIYSVSSGSSWGGVTIISGGSLISYKIDKERQ